MTAEALISSRPDPAATCPADLAPVHLAVEAAARRHPDVVAIETSDAAITYAELDGRANLLAHRLRDAGVGVEDVVGVLVERSVELVVAVLGIWKAGAAFVALDARTPPARRAAVAADTGLAAVVVRAGSGSDVPEPTIAVPATGSAGPVDVRVPLDAAAYIYYSSGATGVPKGAVTEHRCAAGRIAWLARRYDLQPGDRVIHKTPLIFDVAIWEILGPLGAGATILMADAGAESDVAHIAELLGRRGTVFVHFVPSMLRAYLRHVDPRHYPDLRWVQVSGEAVPADLLPAFARHFDVELHNLYGQTETSEVAGWEGRVHDGDVGVPIGRRLGLYRLFVLDPDLNVVAPGVPGELCVAGVGGLARGYRARPGLTAERFLPNPFATSPGERLYRTGDLVVADTRGELTHLGRLDDQVKIRGCRVEPREVEVVLSRHPGVDGCAVVAVPDGSGDLRLVAYVVDSGVVGPGAAALCVDALAEHAATHLPDHLLPSTYVVLDELPVTAAGKLDRDRLPEPTAADRGARASADEPRTPVEAALVEIWKEVLGLDRVGPADSFFAVGGDSLKTLQMLNRVSAWFGVDLSVVDFFADPTLGAVAAAVENRVVEMVAAMSDEEAAELLGQLTPPVRPEVG